MTYKPGTEERDSSMGRVTCASISSGATFGQVVETEIMGRETLGSRLTGNLVSVMAPSTTSAAMRMTTVTG